MRGIDKKGQEMTLGTIIAIVLGIAVLVFLIFGFSQGWNNLWDRVNILGGGSVNVDAISTACSVACQQNKEYSFCKQPRDLVVGTNQRINGVSCNTMSDGTVMKLSASGKAVTEEGSKAVTEEGSKAVSNNVAKTGSATNVVDSCPAIKC